MSFEDIEVEYDVTREDIQAALAFAGSLVQEESFHPLTCAASGSRYKSLPVTRAVVGLAQVVVWAPICLPPHRPARTNVRRSAMLAERGLGR